jgi:hypothetical protein
MLLVNSVGTNLSRNQVKATAHGTSQAPLLSTLIVPVAGPLGFVWEAVS